MVSCQRFSPREPKGASSWPHSRSSCSHLPREPTRWSDGRRDYGLKGEEPARGFSSAFSRSPSLVADKTADGLPLCSSHSTLQLHLVTLRSAGKRRTAPRAPRTPFGGKLTSPRCVQGPEKSGCPLCERALFRMCWPRAAPSLCGLRKAQQSVDWELP